MPVNKITWAQVGHVSEQGRYLLKFGWLTVTADDLAIWEAHPNAAFTLLGTSSPTTEPGDETEEGAAEEFRLGTFELRTNSTYSESEK